jgi:hypothetical protein
MSINLMYEEEIIFDCITWLGVAWFNISIYRSAKTLQSVWSAGISETAD